MLLILDRFLNCHCHHIPLADYLHPHATGFTHYFRNRSSKFRRFTAGQNIDQVCLAFVPNFLGNADVHDWHACRTPKYTQTELQQMIATCADPFDLVERDISNLSDGVKSLLDSDHPVLSACAKYVYASSSSSYSYSSNTSLTSAVCMNICMDTGISLNWMEARRFGPQWCCSCRMP